MYMTGGEPFPTHGYPLRTTEEVMALPDRIVGVMGQLTHLPCVMDVRNAGPYITVVCLDEVEFALGGLLDTTGRVYATMDKNIRRLFGERQCEAWQRLRGPGRFLAILQAGALRGYASVAQVNYAAPERLVHLGLPYALHASYPFTRVAVYQWCGAAQEDGCSPEM